MANCYKPTSALSATRAPVDPGRNVFNAAKAVSAHMRIDVRTGSVPQTTTTGTSWRRKGQCAKSPANALRPAG